MTVGTSVLSSELITNQKT